MTVDCAVTDGYPEASCVLVYREYHNLTLTVKDYFQLSDFSTKLTVNNPWNYTFAIFGKNGDSEIEEKPAFIVKFKMPSSGQCICSVNAVYLSQAKCSESSMHARYINCFCECKAMFITVCRCTFERQS